jgi:hypothetical protein
VTLNSAVKGLCFSLIPESLLPRLNQPLKISGTASKSACTLQNRKTWMHMLSVAVSKV